MFERIREGLRSIDDVGAAFTTARADTLFDPGGAFFATVHAASIAEAPAWATSIPTSSEYFFFVGAGASPSLKAAESAALSDAYARSLAQASAALRAARKKGALTPAEQQALRAYIENSSNVIDRRLVPLSGSTFKAWVLVQMRKSFLDPPALIAFVQPAPPAATWPTPEAVGLKLMPLPPGVTASRESLRVSAARQHGGDFEFMFHLQRTAGGMAVRLDSIRVDDDGSALGTRWSFDIFVNDRHVGAVAPASYDDQRRPAIYAPRSTVETVVEGRAARSPLAVRVIGFKG